MLNYFKSSTPNLLGIDITSTSVKLLELGRSNDKYSVESYAIVPLPNETVVEKVIKDREALCEAVKKALSNAKANSRSVAIAVPDSSVISKILQMDSNYSEQDIENQIAFEAEKYVPYPLDEVSLDFSVLRDSKTSTRTVDVLLVASKTENVENRAGTVTEAGLSVQIVDVESYAVERVCRLLADTFPKKGIDETIAVIDIGATMTNLTVLQDMSVVFTREEVFGGIQLTKAIQRHYGLSYAEAGLAKKEGKLSEDYLREVLTPFRDSVVLQVRRALQFFFSSSQHAKVNHIALAGGTVNVPGLASLIEEQIGISTSILNPFMDMEISKRVDANALKDNASSLVISCGLALRSFEK